jgi:Trk K+ transport system NAD-binding subunit
VHIVGLLSGRDIGGGGQRNRRRRVEGRRGDGVFVSNPRPDVLLEPGTSRIAIGTGEQLKALGRLLKVETPEV